MRLKENEIRRNNNYFSLIVTYTTGKPARYSSNGKRISKDQYEHIIQQSSMYGSVSCLSTKAWPIDNGGTKRKNYTVAQF